MWRIYLSTMELHGSMPKLFSKLPVAMRVDYRAAPLAINFSLTSIRLTVNSTNHESVDQFARRIEG